MKMWIRKPVEPVELILVWQAPDGQKDRLRWAVGVVDFGSTQSFRYFTADEIPSFNIDRTIDQLKSAGFVGYPAFRYEPGQRFELDILKTFLRRLPPWHRSDFDQYQEYFSIESKSILSGPLLLALTEARLPSDGFSLIDPLDASADICDAVFEIAGFRHVGGGHQLEVGDPLELQLDPLNPYDAKAVAVHWDSSRVGFVNRLQAPTVAKWLATRSFECVVIRKNGKPEAPRAYAMISIRPKNQTLAA